MALSPLPSGITWRASASHAAVGCSLLPWRRLYFKMRETLPYRLALTAWADRLSSNSLILAYGACLAGRRSAATVGVVVAWEDNVSEQQYLISICHALPFSPSSLVMPLYLS